MRETTSEHSICMTVNCGCVATHGLHCQAHASAVELSVFARYQPLVAHDTQTVERRVAEIRERAEKATAGPWDTTPDGCSSCTETEWDVGSVEMGGCHAMFARYEDADFIAHAREDIPYLLSKLAEAESRLATLQKEHEGLLRILTHEIKERERLKQLYADTKHHTDEQAVALSALRAAVSELVGEGVPMAMGCCFYCASSQPERRHHSGCNWARLRALIQQGGGSPHDQHQHQHEQHEAPRPVGELPHRRGAEQDEPQDQ